FRTLGGVVLEAIQDIDWGALASEAIELLSQGFSAITSLADDVLDVLTGAFDAIDWSGLGSTILDAITGVDYSGIASTILDAIITGAQAIADFGSRFVGWFIDAVTGVDWQGLASIIIDGIVAGFFEIVDFG